MSGEEAEEDVGYPLPDYAAIDAFGYDVNDKTADFHEETEQQAQAQGDPDPDSVAVPDDCFGFGWLVWIWGQKSSIAPFLVPTTKHLQTSRPIIPCEPLQKFCTNPLQDRTFVSSATCSLIGLLLTCCCIMVHHMSCR